MSKKILINSSYGGFMPAGPLLEYIKSLGIDIYVDKIPRDNEDFIKIVEEYGSNICSDSEYSSIKIVELPDNITDWEINDYDGCEEVIYVLDGKIYHKEWL